MMRCSPEAFAKCPMQKLCGSQQEATFTEGSDCDKFNQEIEKEKNMYENIEEWISDGARPYIAMGVSASAAVVLGILTVVSLIAAIWNVWWLLAFVACGSLCGAMIGIAKWVYDVAF